MSSSKVADPEPEIYQVERVNFDGDRTCALWTGDGPTPCENQATHVFVYEGKIGGDEPKNCVCCSDCAPRRWTRE
jgi:hypothetical protein